MTSLWNDNNLHELNKAFHVFTMIAFQLMYDEFRFSNSTFWKDIYSAYD